MYRLNLKKFLSGLSWALPEQKLNLGDYIAPAVLTSTGKDLSFFIPTGRVYPEGTTISDLTCSIVVRASNSNGGGIYIVENQSTAYGDAPFSLSNGLVFRDGTDTNKTLSPDNITVSLFGQTMIKISFNGTANYYFPGNSTNSGYVNNNACTAWLYGIKVTFNFPTGN